MRVLLERLGPAKTPDYIIWLTKLSKPQPKPVRCKYERKLTSDWTDKKDIENIRSLPLYTSVY